MPRAAARPAACRTRGIVDGPPLRQVCRLRRRPASRRRVDAPPVDGLDVRRSVRDDQTIGPRQARPDLPFVTNSTGRMSCLVRNANARGCTEAVCGGATTARYDACLSPSTRRSHDLQSGCPARSGPDHRPPGYGRAGWPCHRWRRHRCRAVPGLHPAGWRPEQPRTAPRTGRRHRPGQHGHRDRLQDRAGRQHPRRLPDPRLRQQHPGVLDGHVRGERRAVPAGQHDPVLGCDIERVWHGQRGHGSLLLPDRSPRLSRPRLLHRAPDAVRRAGRLAGPGLCARP